MLTTNLYLALRLRISGATTIMPSVLSAILCIVSIVSNS